MSDFDITISTTPIEVDVTINNQPNEITVILGDTAVADEAARAIAAETALGESIIAETNRATTIENSLSSQIQTLSALEADHYQYLNTRADTISAAIITDHESLTNLQGGAVNDHSHVTAVERSYLQTLQPVLSARGTTGVSVSSLGIGKTPVNPLDVVGRVSVRNTPAGGELLFFEPTAFGSAGLLQANNMFAGNFSVASGSMTIGTATANTSDITMRANGISTITIQGTTNKVGIGTSTPTEKLTVVGNISANGSASAERYKIGAQDVLYTTGFSDINIKDASNNLVFRGVRSTQAGVNSQFFQVGTTGDSAVFSSQNGSAFSQMVFVSPKTQHILGDRTLAPVPVDAIEIIGNTTNNKVFGINNSGNLTTVLSTLSSVTVGADLIVNRNVGIGTNSPFAPLHITSAGTTNLRIDSGAGQSSQFQIYSGGTAKNLFGYSSALDGFHIYNYGTAASELTIPNATGRVGIGTTTPNQKLTVVGNISASGSVFETTKTLEQLANKTTVIAASSNSTQYPTASAVYGFVQESTLFCGAYVLPTIIDNGNGTVNISAGEFVFASDSTGTPPRKRYPIAGGTFSLTDNAINFILVDLNGGSPTMTASTSNATVNAQTIYPVFVITRVGNNLDIVDLDHESKGLPNKITLRLARTRRIEPETGGLLISTGANQKVTITAGRAWFSATSTTLPAFDSSLSAMRMFYHSGGAWVSTPLLSAKFENNQYDDGTNLQTLTNNRYAVSFIYRNVANNSNKAYMVLGQGDYTLGQAQLAVPPAPLPAEVANTLFVGRIITEKGATTATQVDSAFTTQFSFAGVTDHESLTNLQGGAVNDHSHVTAVERSYLQSLQPALTGTGTSLTANTLSANLINVLGNPNSLRKIATDGVAITNHNNAAAADRAVFIGMNAGNAATSASDSNFIGYLAGGNAPNACHSNFLGNNAGQGALYANKANFLGNNAGHNATYANDSNFLGYSAGRYANHATNANFLGHNAGKRAYNACNSNFLGYVVGYCATDANNSNFLGTKAGYCATNACHSNFLGNFAGYKASGADHSNFSGSAAGSNATDACYSNFLGNQAGGNADYANNSNFLGFFAGFYGTNANNSNFLGCNAGRNATNACNSNFLGYSAGLQAYNAHNSNFLGANAGQCASGGKYSNFLGAAAGFNATNACYSNFVGNMAGACATNVKYSNFLGSQAGRDATDACNSNFIGLKAGCGATNAYNSNFLGSQAGFCAANAGFSNFLGAMAGRDATNAGDSNFLGRNAGYCAINADHSNFIGMQAGSNATSACCSNFIGINAGFGATYACFSNFIGRGAGNNATSAYWSNFIGDNTGNSATYAQYSNFIGNNAGSNATNASNSNFIGKCAGFGATDACHSTFIGYCAGSGAVNSCASIAIGSCATPTGPNQFALGSAAFPLSVIGGTSLTTSTSGLKILLNGVWFTIPLL